MFKSLGNMAAMLRQAQQMSGRMQEITEQLKQRRVTGSAAGGLIEVELNGLGEMLRLRIDPSLSDLTLLESLVPQAVNQASVKAKQVHLELMQSMTDGLDLPGLNEAISQMTNRTGGTG